MFSKNVLWGLLAASGVGAYEGQTVLKGGGVGNGNGGVFTGHGEPERNGEAGKGGNYGEGEKTMAEICGTCVPREEILRPGVGLDLSVGYGYVFSSFLL